MSFIYFLIVLKYGILFDGSDNFLAVAGDDVLLLITAAPTTRPYKSHTRNNQVLERLTYLSSN